MTILITGTSGFIGRNLLHTLINSYGGEIVCVDKDQYPGNKNIIPDHVRLYQLDLTDMDAVNYLFENENIHTVFHLAAESHVDYSIRDCLPFIDSNITGTVNLMNACMRHNILKFMHVSTDEVYGALGEYDQPFTEETPYNPQNPYSASKAASDHFVQSYVNTYGFPAVITNCSNNFGPKQTSDKLIPKTICNLLQGKKVPVYGKGEQIRDWLYVQDHCEALIEVWRSGRVGEKYNIGGGTELNNLTVVSKIVKLMNKNYSDIEFVTDRPGHDFRYSIDCQKIENELGWKSRFDFDEALLETIKWYENY